ncbi:uncharacterized protein BDV17DRAFT_299784 [Aspergillus undulatus]|uniref:uncharacterized protein n=1 Tax=Aspergillus undulatus TaxID=1810928 RepID=UPI003CCD1971
MLEPIELQVFPSSYNCIAWSEDGELAIATGEYVQVLTPKVPSNKETNGTTSHFPSTNWHRTRFRVNVFTINEWPIMFPQARDHFSVGAEQSMSTVVGVAWSPPGLAKYRRSVLAVLTTNMVLSLYALASGTGKWSRIAIVNKALGEFFRESIENDVLESRSSSFFRRDVEDKSPQLRKTNIRSFTWTPPLKLPAKDQEYPGPESRWGSPLLAVTNEDNEMIFLQLQRPKAEQESEQELRIDAVSAVPLPPSTGYDEVVRSGSLFSSAVRSHVRTLSLASGPWLYQPQEKELNGGRVSATLNVAGIQGTKLRVVRLSVDLEPRMRDHDEEHPYDLAFDATEASAVLATNLDNSTLTGPIQWARVNCGRVSMAVGATAGLAVIELSENAYRGGKTKNSDARVHHYPITVEPTNGITSSKVAHLERISGMTIAIDPESETPILHFGTAGGYAASKPLNGTDAPSPAPWNDQVDDLRERFDIDRDLGGLAVSRVWGLASVQGLVVAVVTQHPGDIVEYRTQAEDRLTVVFSTADGQETDFERVPFLRANPTSSTEVLDERRDVVLQYIFGDHAGTKKALSPKVLYAAACCAIVQSQNAGLLGKAKEVLEKLAASNQVDLTEEIAKCSEPGSSIEAKSADTLDASGGDIFEKCEVCDAGIVWYSAQEAQCVTGHVFGMTLQAV